LKKDTVFEVVMNERLPQRVIARSLKIGRHTIILRSKDNEAGRNNRAFEAYR